MNEPTQEQIKKFWEWCGFKHTVPFPELAKQEDIPRPERFTKEQWYIPGIYCGSEPPIDLNSLFKYAVPKLAFITGNPYSVSLIAPWGDTYGEYGAEIKQPTVAGQKRLALEFSKEPALALFWAIWRITEATDE